MGDVHPKSDIDLLELVKGAGCIGGKGELSSALWSI